MQLLPVQDLMYTTGLFRGNRRIRRDGYIAFNDGTVFQAEEGTGLDLILALTNLDHRK